MSVQTPISLVQNTRKVDLLHTEKLKQSNQNVNDKLHNSSIYNYLNSIFISELLAYKQELFIKCIKKIHASNMDFKLKIEGN